MTLNRFTIGLLLLIVALQFRFIYLDSINIVNLQTQIKFLQIEKSNGQLDNAVLEFNCKNMKDGKLQTTYR